MRLFCMYMFMWQKMFTEKASSYDLYMHRLFKSTHPFPYKTNLQMGLPLLEID